MIYIIRYEYNIIAYFQLYNVWYKLSKILNSVGGQKL